MHRKQVKRYTGLFLIPYKSSISLPSALVTFFWSSSIMLRVVRSRAVLSQCRIDLISSMFRADYSNWRELNSRTALSISSFTFAGTPSALTLQKSRYEPYRGSKWYYRWCFVRSSIAVNDAQHLLQVCCKT